MMEAFYLLLLLLVANGSPLAARIALGGRPARPLDGGRRLADGRPLFGPSKTLRGFVAAIVLTALVAPLLGFSWWLGGLTGLLAMLGDLASSFTKRRLGLEPGAFAPGLDQIPESLLPLLACKPLLGLSWELVLGLPLAFLVANLLISRVMYHLGFREHPY